MPEVQQQTLTYSYHATKRMKEMNVSEDQVDEVVFDCEQSWTIDGETTYQRGELAVAVAADCTVITVLPRTQENYVR